MLLNIYSIIIDEYNKDLVILRLSANARFSAILQLAIAKDKEHEVEQEFFVLLFKFVGK